MYSSPNKGNWTQQNNINKNQAVRNGQDKSIRTVEDHSFDKILFNN